MKGFYGGSFDPVHIGHLDIACAVADTPFVKGVGFVPVYSHPLDKSVTPFEHRVNMLKISVRKYQTLSVSTLEKDRKAVPSYTVDLLEQLTQSDPNCFFMAGMDNLNIFFQWERWRDIVKYYNFTFTTRAGINLDKHVLGEIEASSERIIKFYTLKNFRPGGISVLEVPDYPVSSTEIRKMLLNREPVSGIIPDEVLRYIRENALYLNRI